MSDSGDRESSFELVEEPSDQDKVPSFSVQNFGPLHELIINPFTPNEPIDPHPSVRSDVSNDLETQSIVDLSTSDVSFTQDSPGEATSNLELPSSLALCNRRLSFDQLRNQRRSRTRHVRQLLPKYSRALTADSSRHLPTHRKFVLWIAAAIGIFLALVYVIVRDSYRISQLIEELNAVQLQHAKDLLRESRRCPDQAGLIRNISLEHQLERRNLELEVHALSQQLKAREAELEKLAQESREVQKRLDLDIRTLSDKYQAQLAASGETILELRSERQKLMDAAFSSKSGKKSGKTDCAAIKLENDQLKHQMKYLVKELKRLKAAFVDLQERSIFIPGWRHISRIFCKLFRLCPELGI